MSWQWTVDSWQLEKAEKGANWQWPVDSWQLEQYGEGASWQWNERWQ